MSILRRLVSENQFPTQIEIAFQISLFEQKHESFLNLFVVNNKDGERGKSEGAMIESRDKFDKRLENE